MAVSYWVGYPNSYTAGRNRKPQYVVLHYTAGSEGPSSAEDGAAYDKNRTDGTSTHYFTDSFGLACQEVPEGDRAHAAMYHGNEIGIQIEICGTIQSRAQWLDPVSYPTLVTTAALTRDICLRQGFDMRVLTDLETRMAYYNSADSRPTGITDHGRVTLAYPEDGGTHTDVGTDFPWDVFMDLVLNGEEMADYGNLGPPPNVPDYVDPHPDIMLADMYAALVQRKTGWGGDNSAGGWSLFKDLDALNTKLDKVLEALASAGAVAHKHDGGMTGPAVPETPTK